MVSEKEKEFVQLNIVDYWHVLQRKKLPAGYLFLLFLFLTTLFSIRAGENVYKATGKLLFKPHNIPSKLTGKGSKIKEFDSVNPRGKPLETQANLLTSKLLISSVISKLDQQAKLDTSTSISFIRKNLTVKQIRNADILEISYESNDPEFSEDFVNTLMNYFVVFNKREQGASIESAKLNINKKLLLLRNDYRKAANELKEFMTTNEIISLDVKEKELGDLYKNIKEGESKVKQKLEDITGRTKILKRQLQNNTRLSLLEIDKLNDSKAIQETLSKIKSVESQLEIQLEIYSFRHPIIIELKNEINSLKRNLQKQASLTIGRSIAIQDKDLQLSTLQKELISEFVKFESERQALQLQSKYLGREKYALQKKISDFAGVTQRQKELEQNLSTAITRYSQLKENLAKLDFADIQAKDSSQVKVIESAMASEVLQSRIDFKVLFGGAIFSLVLAIGIALLLDILDTKVQTVSRLRNLVDYPILGIISEDELNEQKNIIHKINTSKAIDVEYTTNNVLSELPFKTIPSNISSFYQEIFINLTLLGRQELPKTIILTGTSINEKNSEISANIAKSLCLNGLNVLLVDASFRSLAQQRIWNLNNDFGLKDILLNHKNLELATQNVIPNLHVITSGLASHEDGFSFHLLNHEFTSFFEKVYEMYDYIIFDADPILFDSNTIFLCKFCESILLTSNLNHMETNEVVEIHEILHRLQITVLGIILLS